MREPYYPDAKRPTTFKDGVEYQDFVCEQLALRGNIVLQNFASKRYQLEIGENLQGFEIKFDARITDTGNVSIEIKEKSRADIPNWTPSGIYRDDNSWLYIQGNYDILFIFAKKFLIELHKSGRYPEHELSTIVKFHIPIDHAKRWSAKYIDFKDPPF